jgi:hypothetical protein
MTPSEFWGLPDQDKALMIAYTGSKRDMQAFEEQEHKSKELSENNSPKIGKPTSSPKPKLRT